MDDGQVIDVRTLIIDNYDSFTFNLYQLIARVAGEEPIVVRNDQMSWDDICELMFDNIVLSPGPGRPDRRADFGICSEALQHATVPILGVCLGHQGIAHSAGAAVVRAPEPMHGRLSVVVHDDDTELFAGIPSRFDVVRYHSLVAQRPLPDDLEMTAWTEDGVVMGLRHRSRPHWGVQFHPESICTEYGERLLENFNRLTRARGTSGRWSVAAKKHSVVPAAVAVEESAVEFELVTRKLPRMPDPERVFVALYGADKMAFWLDSSMVSEGGARFSFMGNADGPLSEHISYRTTTEQLTVTRNGDVTVTETSIFEYLRRRLASCKVPAGTLPFDFNGGFVGYFGYELKRECGAAPGPVSDSPDAQFIFADRLVAFDAKEKTTYLVAVVRTGGQASADEWLAKTEALVMSTSERAEPRAAIRPTMGPAPAFQLARDRQTHIQDTRECLDYILAGETYEVCLTNKVRGRVDAAPLDIYRSLRHHNPAPYAAYFALWDMAIACSSPERFLRVERTLQVEAKPIKGTAPRGLTVEEDENIKEALRTSEKERAENLMIVDLVRNDLGLVSVIGSVTVPKLLQLETFATLHQLVSTIRGQLRSSMTAVDAVRASFPGGSMTGAPKKRTMQIIDELEGEARGVYSGSIGYLSLCGAADLNIVIRTAVLSDGVATIGVGGAVVALSDPVAEYDETLLKSKAVLAGLVASVRPVEEVDASVERIHRQWGQDAVGGGAVESKPRFERLRGLVLNSAWSKARRHCSSRARSGRRGSE